MVQGGMLTSVHLDRVDIPAFGARNAIVGMPMSEVSSRSYQRGAGLPNG